MADRFVKQQKRRRWAETGAVFPPAYAGKVRDLASDSSATANIHAAAALLAGLPNLRSTFAEVEALKGVCSKVCAISDGEAPECDSRLLLLMAEILFMENSRPMQRQLLSGLHRMPPRRFKVFMDCISLQIKEAAGDYEAARLSRVSLGVSDVSQAPRAVLADVMFSLLEFKPLQQHLRNICPQALAALAHGVLDVLRLAAEGVRVQIHTAEEVQDAISGMYAILQLHGSFVTGGCGSMGPAAIIDAAEAMMLLLQNPSLISREGLASAAVLLAAVSALPDVPPADLAATLAAAMWPELQLQQSRCEPPKGSSQGSAGSSVPGGGHLGILGEHLHNMGASLAARLAGMEPLSRVCSVKGLVSVLPLPALCARLPVQQPSCASAADPGTAAMSQAAQPADRQQRGAHAPESRSFPALDEKFAVLQGNAAGRGSMAVPAEGAVQDRPWTFLMSGAIPFACDAVAAAPDAHQKLHAVALLTTSLQRMKECLEEASGKKAVSAGSIDAASTVQFVRHLEEDPLIQPHRDAGGLPAGDPHSSNLTNGLRACATPTPLTTLQLPILTQDVRSRLMSILWANWEEPVNQTVKQIHTAFDAVLDILSLQEERAASLGLPPQDANNFKAFLERTAIDLMSLSSQRKGKYAPVRMLASRMGATWLLRLQPCLIGDMLQAMRFESVCPANAGLLEAVLGSLRHECMESTGSPKEAIARWEAAWVDAMLEALASPVPRLAANVSAYGLSVPLAMESGSLVTLLRRILAPASAAGPSHGSYSDGQVASLVAVLKVARQLNLVRDLDRVTLPGHEAVLVPEALLQRAIEHGNEALLVDAMALVCMHPKSTAVPGVPELRLVAKGLVLGMRCTSVSLRNKWTGLVGKLLRRISSSIHFILHKWSSGPGSAGTLGTAEQAEKARDIASLRPVAAWTQWFTRLLLSCLYPGAPFERKFLAMLLLEALLTTWNTPDKANRQNFRPEDISVTKLLAHTRSYGIELFCPGFPGAEATQVLLSSVVECWDKLRETSIAVLLTLEAPLPGLADPASVEALVLWARKLAGSPRVRESDAGARLQSLVFKKYVLGLGWHIASKPDGSVETQAGNALPPRAAAQACCEAVLCQLDSLVDCLEAEVTKSEDNFEEACRHGLSHGKLLSLRYLIPDIPWHSMQSTAESTGRLKAWMQRLISLALRAASSALQPLSTPQETGLAAADKGDFGEEGFPDEDGEDISVSSGEALAPRGQVVVTGCWLTVKEASLLLGALVREAPVAKSGSASEALFEAQQLMEVGRQLMHYMGVVKHNGAVEKAQAGFIALCERLLREPSAELNQLPRRWLHELLQHLRAPGQHRNDVVRRSAGLPFSFMGLFLAEPPGSHKALLHEGMKELLETAGATAAAEPWPCVHALNVLCQAFNDRHLALDISGFCAEGVATAIGAMAAPAWEIRNSASLAFTALLMRTVGFKNIAKGEMPKRAVTGVEFFGRFPPLHSYLLGQLQEAAQGVQEGTSRMHPSLYPILVLLSRLRLSTQAATNTGAEELSPAVFAPVVRQFALAWPMAVRHLAAQALAPLVTPGQLGAVLEGLLHSIPCSPPALSHNEVHGSLLQVRHLLEAHGASLQSCETQAVLPQTAGLLLERLWLATPLSSAKAVRAAFLRAAGALLSAAHSAEPHDAERNHPAVSALARGVMGVCQEALIGQEQPAEPAHLPQMPASPPAHDLSRPRIAQAAAQPALPAGSAVAGSNGLPDSRTSSHTPAQTAGSPSHIEDRGISREGSSLRSHEPKLEPAGADGADMMRSVFLKEAALLYFSPTVQGLTKAGPTGVQSGGGSDDISGLRHSEVQDALSHPLYDVRAATLKALLARSAGGVPAWLVAIVKEAAAHEQHHKVKRRALQLMALPLMADGDGNQRSQAVHAESATDTKSSTVESGADAKSAAQHSTALEEFQGLQKQLQDAQHPEVQAKALRGVGAALPALAAGASGSPGSAAALDRFLDAVDGARRATQPTEMRAAAVHALQASSLLGSASANSGEPVRLRAWRAWTQVSQLMEDEDNEVRRAAAHTASSAMAASAISCSASANVEHVERMTFDFLSESFGNMPQHQQQLRDWIHRPGLCQLDDSWQPGAISRLFEKELDNHHEEKLLVAQLAAQQLARLLQQQEGCSVSEHCRDKAGDWVLGCLQDLESLSSRLAALQQRISWLGGLTYHQDAFEPLYHMLLAVHAAAACTQEDSKLHDAALPLLRSTARALLSCGMHPLIGHLLYVVLSESLRSRGAASELQGLAAQVKAALADARDPHFTPMYLLQGFEADGVQAIPK